MVDIEHLKDRIQSNPRNPGIIRLFRYAKLSENAGYGIDKMLQWEKLTGNKVCFDSDLTTTVVTYYLVQSKISAGNVQENVIETTPKTTPPKKLPPKQAQAAEIELLKQ